MDEQQLVQYSIQNIGQSLQELNNHIEKLHKAKSVERLHNITGKIAYSVGNITAYFNTMVTMGEGFFTGELDIEEKIAGFGVDN
jgi:prefoldin subunit 5